MLGEGSLQEEENPAGGPVTLPGNGIAAASGVWAFPAQAEPSSPAGPACPSSLQSWLRSSFRWSDFPPGPSLLFS